MNNEEKNHDERGFGEKAKDFIQNLFDRDETPNEQPTTEESHKPRDRGITEYTKDFVSNVFGNDRAYERREEGEATTPHDRGIIEYTKDFVGGLVGRDRDENPTDAEVEKARQQNEQQQGQ